MSLAVGILVYSHRIPEKHEWNAAGPLVKYNFNFRFTSQFRINKNYLFCKIKQFFFTYMHKFFVNMIEKYNIETFIKFSVLSLIKW